MNKSKLLQIILEWLADHEQATADILTYTATTQDQKTTNQMIKLLSQEE